MASVARGKALVAELRKNPKVRDAEALAAWLGRFKKARKAGMSVPKAKAAAGGSGGKGKPKDSPISKDIQGIGRVEYNPKTKIALIPNNAVDIGKRKKTRLNIERIEKAFPGVQKMGTTKENAMPIDKLKRSFGIADRPKETPKPATKPKPAEKFGRTERVPAPNEPGGDRVTTAGIRAASSTAPANSRPENQAGRVAGYRPGQAGCSSNACGC